MIELLKILRVVFKVLFAALFILGGINHFRAPGVYLPMMPPWLPLHLELIYLSGAAELILGVLFLVPRFTRIAGFGLIALLVAIFPANVHMALHPGLFPRIDPVILWLRLPLQGVLIFIAWAYARTPAEARRDLRHRD
jgi:uncharacterized membrane protein